MKTTVLFTSLVVALVASQGLAQMPEFPKPQKEHEWLKQFVGDWESESEAHFAPDQPPIKCKATLSARMLGGFWVVSEMKSEMMGMPMQAIQTIGYNVEKKKYVGTWIDSMFNHMWNYEGTVDSTGKVLTLEAEGPNMFDPTKTARFRDIYEFKSKDHVAASSQMQGEDGKWVTFMTGNSKRVTKK